MSVSIREFELLRDPPIREVSNDASGSPAFASSLAEGRWLLPIDHMSATQLNMLAVCPRQWQQRYLKNRKERPGQAVVIGAAFHKTHEFNYRQKIQTYEDVNAMDLYDYFHDLAWPESIGEHGGYNEIQWDVDPEDARTIGSNATEMYYCKVSNLVQPTAVEDKFSVQLETVPIPVVGIIDVKQGFGLPAIDMKTSAKKLSKPKPSWRLQGKIYQLEELVDIDFHVVTKAKDPSVVTPSQAASMTHIFTATGRSETVNFVTQMAWLANNLYEKYGPDEDWPATGQAHDWRCDWCAYKGDCPAWRM